MSYPYHLQDDSAGAAQDKTIANMRMAHVMKLFQSALSTSGKFPGFRTQGTYVLNILVSKSVTYLTCLNGLAEPNVVSERLLRNKSDFLNQSPLKTKNSCSRTGCVIQATI